MRGYRRTEREQRAKDARRIRCRWFDQEIDVASGPRETVRGKRVSADPKNATPSSVKLETMSTKSSLTIGSVTAFAVAWCPALLSGGTTALPCRRLPRTREARATPMRLVHRSSSDRAGHAVARPQSRTLGVANGRRLRAALRLFLSHRYPRVELYPRSLTRQSPATELAHPRTEQTETPANGRTMARRRATVGKPRLVRFGEVRWKRQT